MGDKPIKRIMHPRNRHNERYDFENLIKSFRGLSPFVTQNQFGDLSIDFANPDAVKALNKALLIGSYGVSNWDLPPGYLCPPIPGRSDYIHYVADLLSSFNKGTVPRGASIRILDIGVGANCIYPILGHGEYEWNFLGSDIDPVALASAKKIIESNPDLAKTVELRLQKSPSNIFKGLVKVNDKFDLAISNPPFHESLEKAKEGSQRKWKNLNRGTSPKKISKTDTPALNFGGQETELWYPGGESSFVRLMIEESISVQTQVFWFTSLISKESNLPGIYRALKRIDVADCRTIEMAQGQKKSRIIAWTFLNREQQTEWSMRW